MNSRRAQNEIRPKSDDRGEWPIKKAAARMANRIHQARNRGAERFEDGRVDAALRPPLQDRTIAEAAPNSSSTPPTRLRVR